MKRARGTLGGLLFLVGSMLWAPSASSAGGSRLVYGRTAASEVCPGEAELRAAVRERLGYDPFFPWAEQTIVVHIAARPHRRIGGKVYLVDSAGRASPEREFTTSEGECRELVLALALAIVMTLDPLHGRAGDAPSTAKPPTDAKPPAQNEPPSVETSRAEAPSRAPAGDANPAAASAQRAAPLAVQVLAPGKTSTPEGADAPSSRATAPSSRFTAELGGALFVASGVTPGISTGFIPSLRGRVGDFSVSLEGRIELPMWSSFDSDRVDASLVGGSVVPCVHWKPLVWCGTMLMGRYQAEGHDVAARSASALFASVGARLSAEMPMSSNVWGFVRVEGLVNLTRHELVVAAQPIWSVPPVGFTLSAGALTSFL